MSADRLQEIQARSEEWMRRHGDDSFDYSPYQIADDRRWLIARVEELEAENATLKELNEVLEPRNYG